MIVRSPRVLLLPSPVNSGSVGSVTKHIGLAKLLTQRGCQVCFGLGGKLGALVREHGFTVVDCPVPIYAGTTQKISNIVDFIQWTGLADPEYIAQAVKSEISIVRSFRPDIIFAQARPSAAIAAAATQIPLATIASWPMHPAFPANRSAIDRPLPVFNQQLQHYRLSEIQHTAELLFLRSTLKISPSLPELEPELQQVSDIHFVGYMLDLKKEQKRIPSWLDGWLCHPLILVYLSVGAISPQVYLRTLPEAFESLPFNVLCAGGFHFHLHNEDFAHHQGRVRFVDFVPIQNLIEKAELVIFHGGQDTMLMTLLHGLPSIVLPGQHFERAYNASQLERTGATRRLPVHAFRPRRLQQVVQEVWQGTYSVKSKELAGRLQGFKGAEQAIDLILEAAQ
jgi:UDP:flavonoid glycosyltransferase YjiC (YdhE family)